MSSSSPAPGDPSPHTSGLIVAAPRSGSGKTVLTLGFLRALHRRGISIASGKVGPDYIDPAFHAAATGHPCLSLDSWAMRPQSLATLCQILRQGPTNHMAVIEGVMGLFDGAPCASIATELPDDAPAAYRDGSTASLAALTGWPVVLVLDVTGQSASAAAVARGFLCHDPAVHVQAVVLNRVAGARHEETLRQAFARTLPDLPILGAVPRDARLDLPHRHLGLVQAGEHQSLEAFLNAAATLVESHVDMEALSQLARTPCRAPWSADGGAPFLSATPLLPPPGQRIAVASDVAFAFAYPAQLESWRTAGAEVTLFSPLNDEAPSSTADAVYLPGGYPELHAPVLSAASTFLAGLRTRAAAGAILYGECGGFMSLGDVLIDADGHPFPMAGLLPLTTSFAQRRLHLGYRRARFLTDGPFGPKGTIIRGHEFHYASVIETPSRSGPALLQAEDACGQSLGPIGLCNTEDGLRIFGSFLHAIDRESGPSKFCL